MRNFSVNSSMESYLTQTKDFQLEENVYTYDSTNEVLNSLQRRLSSLNVNLSDIDTANKQCDLLSIIVQKMLERHIDSLSIIKVKDQYLSDDIAECNSSISSINCLSTQLSSYVVDCSDLTSYFECNQALLSTIIIGFGGSVNA